jgi:GTPase
MADTDMENATDHDTLSDLPYKAGFVAVLGRPNVGKSTLLNALLQHPVAAVSPKPQTTRKRQLGILTLEAAQIIFEDTPGVHKPLHKLGECMNQEAIDALEQTDLLLFLVDASRPPNEEDQILAGWIAQVASATKPVVLGLNKIDLADEASLEEHQAAYQALAPLAQPTRLAATQTLGLDDLVNLLVENLPEHPPFFPPDQLTDLYERDIAADLIRAAALDHLRDEVPYSLAVRIDEYTEREEHGAYIAATLFVERESQKGIVIGQKGGMLKQIGTAARHAIEAMSDRKVFLTLRVKTRKNWRNDPDTLKLFGFKPDRLSQRFKP